MKFENAVDEIKNRCNIVDVIGRCVPLKKAGSNYKGVCPFHNEKTPSFVVSEEKQIFTCFGCGASGDVIEFVQRYENLDFHGAVQKLAEECGVDLTKSSFGAESRKEVYYEWNREAAAYFYKVFRKSVNPGIAYMQKRGLKPETLQKFGIGYADENWDSLYWYLKGKGADEKILLSLGLISDSKGRYYDKFRNRVIFPIINTRGKVIGFGGRVLGDGTPKYLNSPESPVFLKKNNLYGLNLSRQDINKEDCAILVEGYMDVISLYQHGIRNVAASLGTALTENQAAMLKRYTNNVILSYDADEAGKAAALRGMDILHKAGCKVKVLHISDGKDPDEFIKKNGRDAFRSLLKEALPFADYKLALLKEKSDLRTTDGNVVFLQKAAEILRELSPVEADIYVRKLAAETHISEGAIRMEMRGAKSEANNVPSEKRRSETKKTQIGGRDLLERNLIRLMLLKGTYIPRTEPYASAFKDPVCYRIYEVIRSLYQSDEEIDLKKLEDSLDNECAVVLGEIVEHIQLSGNDEQMFEDCIEHIRIGMREKREAEIIKLLEIMDEEKEKTAIEDLTKELMQIQREKSRGGFGA